MLDQYRSLNSGTYTEVTSSSLIKTGGGQLLGIFVASASNTPTIKLWDNTSGATTVLVNTFTPTAAAFYSIPVKFQTGLYITIGGTVDCTVIYN
jgi:WD40 repeat protein